MTRCAEVGRGPIPGPLPVDLGLGVEPDGFDFDEVEPEFRISSPLIPGWEDERAWQRHCLAVTRGLRPVGDYEAALATKVAGIHWKLDRLNQREVAAIGRKAAATQGQQPAIPAGELMPDPQTLKELIQYESHLERNLQRALNQLHRIQKERQAGERSSQSEQQSRSSVGGKRQSANDPSLICVTEVPDSPSSCKNGVVDAPPKPSTTPKAVEEMIAPATNAVLVLDSEQVEQVLPPAVAAVVVCPLPKGQDRVGALERSVAAPQQVIPAAKPPIAAAQQVIAAAKPAAAAAQQVIAAAKPPVQAPPVAAAQGQVSGKKSKSGSRGRSGNRSSNSEAILRAFELNLRRQAMLNQYPPSIF